MVLLVLETLPNPSMVNSVLPVMLLLNTVLLAVLFCVLRAKLLSPYAGELAMVFPDQWQIFMAGLELSIYQYGES